MKGASLSIFALAVFLLSLHEADKLPLYDWVEKGIYLFGGVALLLVLYFYRRHIRRSINRR